MSDFEQALRDAAEISDQFLYNRNGIFWARMSLVLGNPSPRPDKEKKK